MTSSSTADGTFEIATSALPRKGHIRYFAFGPFCVAMWLKSRYVSSGLDCVWACQWGDGEMEQRQGCATERTTYRVERAPVNQRPCKIDHSLLHDLARR